MRIVLCLCKHSLQLKHINYSCAIKYKKVVVLHEMVVMIMLRYIHSLI